MSEYTATFTKIASVAAPLLLLLISHCTHSAAIKDVTGRLAVLEGATPDQTQQIGSLVKDVKDILGPVSPKLVHAPKGANGAKEPKK